jgi:hypothetical protein
MTVDIFIMGSSLDCMAYPKEPIDPVVLRASYDTLKLQVEKGLATQEDLDAFNEKYVDPLLFANK